MAEQGQKVSFLYKGSFPDGEVFDDGTADPHEIVIGRHTVMRPMEDALAKLDVGEECTLMLAAGDAYGLHDERAVQHFPAYKVPGCEGMPVGEYIGWTSPRNPDHPIPAKVVSIENGEVTLDFNHPLAGTDIVYWLKVVDIAD